MLRTKPVEPMFATLPTIKPLCGRTDALLADRQLIKAPAASARAGFIDVVEARPELYVEVVGLARCEVDVQPEG